MSEQDIGTKHVLIQNNSVMGFKSEYKFINGIVRVCVQWWILFEGWLDELWTDLEWFLFGVSFTPAFGTHSKIESIVLIFKNISLKPENCLGQLLKS